MNKIDPKVEIEATKNTEKKSGSEKIGTLNSNLRDKSNRQEYKIWKEKSAEAEHEIH